MRKDSSIKRNYQFRYIFNNTKPVRKYYTNVYILKSRYRKNRLGITLNKDIKGAVQRNRAKRLVRESMNLLKKDIKNGYDIIININRFSKNLKATDIYIELKDVFNKLDLINEKDFNKNN